MRYTVIIERTPENYAAYVPDLPGCVATGDTRKEVEQNIREAILFHLETLREDGFPLPEPTTESEVVEVPM
jgi:predicted RNase H-like HicB family nuclease